jgi:GDP-L-fucose synthase
MKQILVAGHSGFLGKAVLEQFKQYDVSLLTPSSKELDLTSESCTLDYFDKFRPSKVLHMGAYVGGIGKNLNNPFNMLYLNSKMAMNIFAAIERYGCDYLCALGSVCMYWSECPVPFKEEDMLKGAEHFSNRPYGSSKRLLLSLFEAYRREYPNFKSSFLVPVNLMGPNDHFDLQDSHVIPGLIRKFVEATENGNNRVNCFGTGLASREFLHVNDCARAIVKTVVEEIDYPEPINLGTGQSILIKDLACLIADLTGFHGEIVFTGEVGDGQFKRQLDVSRAKEILGFEANINLKDGLIETIQWYKENRINYE